MKWQLIHADSRDAIAAMADSSIDSVVCDPPYEIAFMGKGWDNTGIANDVALWSEVLRVLKPGGHLIAFSATRTIHRMTSAIEDAGFQIRDQIAWMNWQGFPKSLDVSKAMDRQRDDRDQILQVTTWIASARDAAGMTNAQIDQAFGFAGMAGHWTSQASQPSVPTIEQIPPLLEILGLELEQVPPGVRDLIWTLNGRKGQPGANWGRREVVGRYAGDCGGLGGARLGGSCGEITPPASEAAAKWEGWGTALKPAYEPAILARKQPEGTIADNVQAWGTGAINIGACRYGYRDPAWPGPHAPTASVLTNNGSPFVLGSTASTRQVVPNDDGRWPANLYVCPKPHRSEREAGCEGLEGRTGAEAVDRVEGSAGMDSPRAGAGRTAGTVRNHHPTVKPIGVLRWLVRLVTPPGGVVLDPFNGSGSTGCACALEGFDYIGIDMEAEYIEISEARIRWWHDQRTPTATEAKAMDRAGRRPVRAVQIGLFDEGGNR